MPSNQIPSNYDDHGAGNANLTYEEVKKANEEAFVHFTLHDFQILIETRGVEFVMNKMDEETYRKLEVFFDPLDSIEAIDNYAIKG